MALFRLIKNINRNFRFTFANKLLSTDETLLNEVNEDIPETSSNNSETAVIPVDDKRRIFEKSKTVTNVILPLKTTRMANPFPDPVKSMHSQIISDQDKREQMFEEAKQNFDTLRRTYFK